MQSQDLAKLQQHKHHSKQKAGKRVNDLKKKNIQENKTRGTNMKAFAVQNLRDVRYRLQRRAQVEYQTAKMPIMKRQGDIPAPDIVAVIGPKGVGKTTLVQSLVKAYSGQNINTPLGPITVSVSTDHRITIYDVPSKLTAILDIAHIVDLIIIVIDIKQGFQTEHFEYLNILQTVGFPKVLTVLTKIDQVNHKYLKLKKQIKQRIEKEIANGCKVFEMPWYSLKNTYKKEKVITLSRCIAAQKFKMPIQWKQNHGFVLIDRIEMKKQISEDQEIVCFGYVRGTVLRQDQEFHIPGYSDVKVISMTQITDPALPGEKLLLSKNKPVLYAPMSEIGNVRVDSDAIHVKMKEKQRGKATKLLDELDEAQKQFQSQNEKQNDIITLFDTDDIPIVNQEDNENLNDSRLEMEEEIEEDFEEEIDEYEVDTDNDNQNSQSQESNISNNWMQDASDEDEVMKSKDVSFESTADKLDVDSEYLANYVEEQTEDDLFEDVAEAKVGNEQLRIQQILKKLHLVKEEASNHFYHNLIYEQKKNKRYNKQKKEKQQNKIQLFSSSDEEEEDQDVNTDIEYFQRQYKSNYYQAPFIIQRDSSKQFPKFVKFDENTQKVILDEQNINQDQHLSIYFLNDTDFCIAVHKCIDGVLAEDDDERNSNKEEQSDVIWGETSKNQKDKQKNVKTHSAASFRGQNQQLDRLNLQIDGKFLDEQNKEAARRGAREQLIKISPGSFLPGAYVRVTFKATKDFLSNKDPRSPLILGGLQPIEAENMFVVGKIKRHRWFFRPLKSRNPITVSVGWRRYQTLPFYGIEKESDASKYDSALITENPPIRALKYTPGTMHCATVFWGYGVASGTGIVCFQDVKSEDFRICANGVVMDCQNTPMIYKKLKLIGYCDSVHKHTAFISQMFNSKLEAGAFQGAGVRTISGIRGILKRPQGDNGLIRAAFEDQVRLHDCVFVKTFVRVKVDRFVSDWDEQRGGERLELRQQREIRAEKQIQIKYKTDSIYKQEERTTFVPQSLRLEADLVRKLPFKEAQRYAASRGGISTLIVNKNGEVVGAADDLGLNTKPKSKLAQELIRPEYQKEREKLSDFLALNKANHEKRVQNAKQEAYAKQRWQEGQDRKGATALEELRAQHRKDRRIAAQKAQADQIKRNQLDRRGQK